MGIKGSSIYCVQAFRPFPVYSTELLFAVTVDNKESHLELDMMENWHFSCQANNEMCLIKGLKSATSYLGCIPPLCGVPFQRGHRV